jgi:hypothetical protein
MSIVKTEKPTWSFYIPFWSSVILQRIISGVGFDTTGVDEEDFEASLDLGRETLHEDAMLSENSSLYPSIHIS